MEVDNVSEPGGYVRDHDEEAEIVGLVNSVAQGKPYSAKEVAEADNTCTFTILSSPLYRWSPTQFLSGSMKQIDYVLIYEKGGNSQADEKKRIKRDAFESSLKTAGLLLEYDGPEQSSDSKTCFLKIHAPWDVLTQTAELLRIKMPIKVADGSTKTTYEGWFERCFSDYNPFLLPTDLAPPQPDYFTAAFNRQLMDKFVITDKDTFFSRSQRSRMVWEILSRTCYDPVRLDRIGIQRLIKNGTYIDAYPLHEGAYQPSEGEGAPVDASSIINERQLLYESWARPRQWYKYQPLDFVRKYFGEKIGLYFAWLGFYTKALLPAALVGIICVLYGAATVSHNIPSNEICNNSIAGSTVMCPLCNKICNYWYLNASCSYSKFSYVFDNTSTVIFAIFMSIWATLFLEFWKRQQAHHQWNWDLMDFELEEEQERPAYASRIRNRKAVVSVNPVTKEEEYSLPSTEKCLRITTSAITVVFFLCLVLAFVAGTIIYRIIVSQVMHANPIVQPYASVATATTAAMLNLICIMVMGKIYESLAWYLTDLEFPRTETEFENSYTFKVFLFQFINYYSSLFYIAFFKGKFSSAPGETQKSVFGSIYRPEQCDPSGCLVELLIQLVIIMVGKQIMNNVIEILFPIVWNWWRSRGHKWKSEKNLYSRWEKDYHLNDLPAMPLFDEYLEMVIQYGFVTLFVAAFPLAPLFAFLNNIIEIRLDAFKFVTAYRRPMPQRAKDIGIWYQILDGISNVAVVTNACVIAFTTDFVPHIVYMFKQSRANYLFDLSGFIDYSLSQYLVSDIPLDARPMNLTPSFEGLQYCMYPDYRRAPCNNATDPDECRQYTFSSKFWHMFAAKLAFVIIFEHTVFLVKGFFSYIVPDVPKEVAVRLQEEYKLAKKARLEYELERRAKGIEVKDDSEEIMLTEKVPSLHEAGDSPSRSFVSNANQQSPEKFTVTTENTDSDFRYSPHNSLASDAGSRLTKF